MLDDHPQFRLPEPKLKEALSYFRRRDVSEGEILIEQVRSGCTHHPQRRQVSRFPHLSGARWCQGFRV